ncbi:MAG: CinA family protein [Clostridia bacterium]|nr:CinA family protein [Clostridia bacterium]
MDNLFLTPEERLVCLLKEKGYKISLAESCTGGLVAGSVVSVADASSVFDCSFVTYSNDSKIRFLNVKKDTIDKYGVVSEEVAYEMALGVSRVASSEIGVGITGIAGPTGGSEEKPVGMVCFGFNICGNVITKTVNFGDIGRNEVRQEACTFAIRTLAYLLENNN